LFKSLIHHPKAKNSRRILICLFLALLGAACSSQLEDFPAQRNHPLKFRIHSQHDAIPSEREALQKLCEVSSRQIGSVSFTSEDLSGGDRQAWKQVFQGIENARKLLPLAKDLTVATFHEHAEDFHLASPDLKQAESYIRAVNSIVLDESLDNAAEVDDQDPQKIRVGPEYALHLTADEEIILLLGHELTHVAAWSERLDPFIERSAQKARQVTGVSPTEDQKEDFACDYIGAQVLKEFIRLRPARESAAERFSIPLGGCEDETGEDTGDEEHLSEGDTLRALIGLDPELQKMILQN
jgi:hypothetical protein